jgi:hypothetical protein
MFKSVGHSEFKLGDKTYHFFTDPQASWDDVKTIGEYIAKRAAEEIEKLKASAESKEEKANG